METLAYLHLYQAFEDKDSPELAIEIPHFWHQWNWHKPSNLLLMRLVSRAICLAFASACTSALLLAGVAETAFGIPLRFGDTGAEVSRLQERLRSLGYFRDNTTGYYGQNTETAVRNFQQYASLSVDGIYGENTDFALRSLLGEANAAAKVLKVGDRGLAVRKLQERLVIAGYPNVAIDDNYGSQTQEAVRLFQVGLGLRNQNGMADLETQAALGEKLYVVVVPARNQAIFNRVLAIFPTAFLAPYRLGTYVHVGSYLDRNIAEIRVEELRRQGIRDARVAYL
ncbi:MAG: hypothetical protein Fur0025_14910 [Oscillatoriaceae cyanobacterium]